MAGYQGGLNVFRRRYHKGVGSNIYLMFICLNGGYFVNDVVTGLKYTTISYTLCDGIGWCLQ